MAIFTFGIGFGSFLCNKLLKGRVHTTYLPFSASVMTVALFFLGWLTKNNYFINNPDITSFSQFFSDIYGWGFALALFLISASGGFFVVPLYTYIQLKTPKENCSHVIGGTNILSSLFMILSGIFVMFLIWKWNDNGSDFYCNWSL